MTANQINWFSAKEQARHNRATEQVQEGTLKETERHNFGTESLTHESNIIQDWMNRETAAHYARQDAINDAHYNRMDSETLRHNVGVETETNRHNVSEENRDAIYKSRMLGIEEQRAAATTEQAAAASSQAESASLNAYTNYVKVGYVGKELPYNIEKTKSTTELSQNQATYYKYKPVLEGVGSYLNYKASTSNSKSKEKSSMVSGLVKVLPTVLPKILPLIK